MFSSVGLAAAVFDWDSERINYDSVRKHFDELELVKRLRSETIFCDKCRQRRVVDSKKEGTVYCTCPNSNTKAMATNTSKDSMEKSWQPYMERDEMIVWRREERPGMFAYKGQLIEKRRDEVDGHSYFHSRKNNSNSLCCVR